MLSVLRIQNLAIVESLEVEFESGLNVLTGETGAGKSIVLKAIELLTGRRTTGDIIRTGAERCTVEGLFRLSEELRNSLCEQFPDLRNILVDEELIIKRVIDGSGRSKISLNGQLATAAMVQNISPSLIDITGQHQQQTLLDPDRHLSLLDAAGVPESLTDQVAKAYAACALAQRQLENFVKDQNARAEHLARLQSEFEELTAAGVRSGLRKELETEMTRLSSVEQLTATLNRSLHMIEEGDENLESLFSALTSELSGATRLDPKLQSILELVENAATHLDETKRALNDYGAKLEADPDQLEVLRTQISELARLERKYGKREDELALHLERVAEELKSFEHGGLDEKTLALRAAETEKELRKVEEQLTATRTKIAKNLAAEIQKGLRELGMKHAEFQIPVSPASSSPEGADHVEFLLSANPGEPARPIHKIASGGELSRILLVLKTVLNERSGALTQIFDEVDTGISGAVSQIVGERLARVSKVAQVILVTHSPQIAAFAHMHLFIAKTSVKGATKTTISALSEKGRVEKLAAMLGGKSTSDTFIKSAEELIITAQSLR